MPLEMDGRKQATLAAVGQFAEAAFTTRLRDIRAASRFGNTSDQRISYIGFRLARTLNP
jgi:formylglycine-generating enzyme required for sulfatase activity